MIVFTTRHPNTRKLGGTSGLFPRRQQSGLFGEEFQSSAELSVFREERMEALAVQSVGIVAVSARGDGFAFAERPSHPAETCRTQELVVVAGTFGTAQIIQAAGDALIDQKRLGMTLLLITVSGDQPGERA